MKISLDKYGCCTASCVYSRECAQHESAGDFRSESGFTPQLNTSECFTADQKARVERYNTVPENVESLGMGFIPLERILHPDYEI